MRRNPRRPFLKMAMELADKNNYILKAPRTAMTYLQMNSGRMKVLKFICMLAVGGTERQFVYATKALHEAGLDMYTGVMKEKGLL